MIANLATGLVLGILAPVGAVCVWPLYPGFLAYLSNKLTGAESRRTFALLGLLATLGVLTSLAIVGLVFSTILQASLTGVIEIASPIAFAILGIISVLLILDVDFSRFFPQTKAHILKNPLASAYVFGLFFGVVVLPCNPGPIIALFALSTTAADILSNMLFFLGFGLGMGLPLLAFSVISTGKSKQMIGWMSARKTLINRVLGSIMLFITIYFLFFDFKVIP